jgi:peptidoglycan/LPS O-acetylase OafA/YrhL
MGLKSGWRKRRETEEGAMNHFRKRRATAARAATAVCLAAIVCGTFFLGAGSLIGPRPAFATAIGIAVAIAVLSCAVGILLMHVLSVEHGDAALPQAPETNPMTFTPPPLERSRWLTRVK